MNLHVLKESELSILNSIVKLLESFDVGSLRLLKDNNEFVTINFNYKFVIIFE
jgi:hypothetical protein